MGCLLNKRGSTSELTRCQKSHNEPVFTFRLMVSGGHLEVITNRTQAFENGCAKISGFLTLSVGNFLSKTQCKARNHFHLVCQHGVQGSKKTCDHIACLPTGTSEQLRARQACLEQRNQSNTEHWALGQFSAFCPLLLTWWKMIV